MFWFVRKAQCIVVLNNAETTQRLALVLRACVPSAAFAIEN
jgi:hypothetical protein